MDEDLMQRIDAYAESRHVNGCHTYNAKTAEARAAVVAAMARWPKDAAEVREFMASNFEAMTFGNPDQSPSDNDRYQLTAHDFLSAVNWWADFPNYETEQGGQDE